MKRVVLILIIISCFLKGYTQITASDNNVPPVLPPPVDTGCKKIQQKLISFTLPCCIDTTMSVRSIASWAFDNPACPIPCGKVVFNPETLSPSGSSAYYRQTVTATACGVTLSANTQLVNSNISLGVTPINFNFANLGKSFENAMTAICNGGVSPCKPTGSLIPAGSISFESSYICCPTKTPCVQISNKYSGNVSWNYGMTCHFPIFGCPYVASLDGVISANASAGFGANFQTGCTTNKFCVNGNGTLSLGGGVGATLLAGFVSAELQLIVSGGLSAEYCFSPPPPAGTAKINIGQVQIVGSVSEVWGLISHSVSFVVYDGWTSPSIPF